MPPISNDEKRETLIDRRTKALLKMHPGRRRGDVAAVSRLTGELTMLRAVQLRNQKKRR